MVAEGFVRPQHRGMVLSADAPEALLDALVAYQPPTIEKWIGRDPT